MINLKRYFQKNSISLRKKNYCVIKCMIFFSLIENKIKSFLIFVKCKYVMCTLFAESYKELYDNWITRMNDVKFLKR